MLKAQVQAITTVAPEGVGSPENNICSSYMSAWHDETGTGPGTPGFVWGCHNPMADIWPAPMAERSNALSCPLAVIARRSLCPEKLGSNPGQGSKGINFSGWHGLDMSVTVTKRR